MLLKKYKLAKIICNLAKYTRIPEDDLEDSWYERCKLCPLLNDLKKCAHIVCNKYDTVSYLYVMTEYAGKKGNDI